MGVRGYAPESQFTRSHRAPELLPGERLTSSGASSPSSSSPSRIPPSLSKPTGPVRPLCKGKYDEAEAHFAVGAYPETIALMAVCASDATFTWAEAASAYRMLALSYFYEGDQRASRQALVHLFEREPDYEPSYALDPPTYATFVRNLRLELKLISSADYRCDELVADSQDQYVAGNYAGVLNLLHGCLNEPALATSVALRTHRLAALAHMKEGNIDAAREMIKALLGFVPDYRADAVQDVPAYVALVDLAREEHGRGRSPWGW